MTGGQRILREGEPNITFDTYAVRPRGRVLTAPVKVGVLRMKMKTFSPDEILSYARRQVAHAEQQRFVKPVMGLLILAIPVWLAYTLKEKSEALGTFLPLDEHFLLGVAFGVMFIILTLIGGMCVVGILNRLKGIEYQALKRLIELEENQTENNTSELTSGGRADASPGGSST